MATTSKKKTTTKKEPETKGTKTNTPLITLLEYYQALDLVVKTIDDNIAIYTQGNKLESLTQLPEHLASQLPDRQALERTKNKVFNKIKERMVNLTDEDIK